MCLRIYMVCGLNLNYFRKVVSPPEMQKSRLRLLCTFSFLSSASENDIPDHNSSPDWHIDNYPSWLLIHSHIPGIHQGDYILADISYASRLLRNSGGISPLSVSPGLQYSIITLTRFLSVMMVPLVWTKCGSVTHSNISEPINQYKSLWKLIALGINCFNFESIFCQNCRPWGSHNLRVYRKNPGLLIIL